MVMHADRVAPEKTVFSARPAAVLFPAERMEKRMAKIPYAVQLKDPRWQKKRLERLQLAGWECENCGSSDDTLHVHHLRYFKGRSPWEYENDELAVLCEGCHTREHEAKDLLLAMLADAGPGSIERVVGLVGGYLNGNLLLDSDLLAEKAAGTGAREYAIGILGAMFDGLDFEETKATIRKMAPHAGTPTVDALVESWKAQG